MPARAAIAESVSPGCTTYEPAFGAAACAVDGGSPAFGAAASVVDWGSPTLGADSGVPVS
jgi:hypothetical protein